MNCNKRFFNFTIHTNRKMKLSLFNENKKVLLVGEGNFSFAVTLVKCNVNINLVASCYENDVQETGKKNIDILEKSGIRVLVGVDATKLEEHKILSSERFDIVVFNFPHVGGKMRIEKNRDLIRKFFISVKSILQNDGKILLSLCDGQGGTPADKTNRKWNDSWQVTEMAAHGDFILITIEPFDSSLFETYTVTGYRSLEKQFNTEGSLTHIFKLAEKPNKNNIAPRHKIDLNLYFDKPMAWKDLFKDNDDKYIQSCKNNFAMYPNSYKFDITFIIQPEFNCVKFYEILYNNAGLIIDDVEFIGSYIFSNLKETRSFRITYKSKVFPLYRKLVINIHEKIIAEIIESKLHVLVSR